ncbi:hypothetical protein BC628DRAFT_1384882 [Trametes gibbosa]|nr:hypothetical protein BC628DRAFT_1384882 [Trametes gibbosa]
MTYSFRQPYMYGSYDRGVIVLTVESFHRILEFSQTFAMPLFRSSPPPPPPPPEAPTRSRGFFGRHSVDSPENNNSNGHNQVNANTSTRSSRSGGLFSRHRSSSSDSDRSLDLSKDPSIKFARQKVTEAETAESVADRALSDARAAVRSARDHVRRLEQEALEEARRAKAKQAEAKTIRKSTGRLGRHG